MTNPILVQDVMISEHAIPRVAENALLKEALDKMSAHSLGIVCITNSPGFLKGVLTDGDLRRKLLTIQKPLSALLVDDVADHMHPNPVTVAPICELIEAIELMEDRQVWDLPVVDRSNKCIGLVHLHPAIKALLLRI